MNDIAYTIDRLEEKAVSLKNAVSKLYPIIHSLSLFNPLSILITLRLVCLKKKYLEALKKYEEVILLKRDTYGEKSETVSCAFFTKFLFKIERKRVSK